YATIERLGHPGVIFAASERRKSTMLGDVALMLLWTFGLSRLLLYIIPNSVAARSKIVVANLGSVLLMALIYVVLAATDPGIKDIVIIGVPSAAACQALWYWRDLSKLPAQPEFKRDQPMAPRANDPKPRQTQGQTSSSKDRWNALVRYDDEIRAAADQ